jgi:hypothetical protein
LARWGAGIVTLGFPVKFPGLLTVTRFTPRVRAL